jgi:diadenosine tetraphosphate (Ap4A) HIT family hydrolase
LADLLPVAKKVALALGAENYNILNNNGRLAHQEVPHVHYHIIPKNANGGLGIKWPVKKETQEELSITANELAAKIAKM